MALTGYLAQDAATAAGQKFSQNLATGEGGFLGIEVSAACLVTVRGGRAGGAKLFNVAALNFTSARSDGVEIPRGIRFVEIEVSAILATFTAEFLPGGP